MPFIPLEANPEVFLPLADELGLPLDKYGLHVSSSSPDWPRAE